MRRQPATRTRGSASSLRWQLTVSSRPRRILADEAVDRLAEKVGVADVAGVLVVQIDEDAPEVRRLPGLDGEPARLIGSAIGEHAGQRGAGPLDGPSPPRVPVGRPSGPPP